MVRYFRPRTTYDMKNRIETLAKDLAEEPDQVRGFHDAITVIVEHLEHE